MIASVRDSEGDRPRINLVEGSPGIGKTTLIGEFCNRIERAGAPVIAANCEMHPSEPYEPVSQLLRQMIDLTSFEDTSSIESMPSLLKVNLEDSSATSTSSSKGDGITARFQLFEKVANWICQRCANGTTLVIEDLHWADRPTLLLLRHILRHPTLTHLRLVGTYRDDDIGADRLELVLSLVPPSQCQVVHLRPFIESEARSLVQTTAPPESVSLLADHARALCDATDGNPFFLRELLRELDDESLKLTNTAELLDALSTIAPVGVRDLVGRRMARLSPGGVDLLFAAAILGEAISTELLSAIGGLSAEAVLSFVEEGLAMRLLVEDQQAFDRFLFPHSLVRNAVYASIPPERRLELHRRTAGALVNQPTDSVSAATVARHFCEAAELGLQAEASSYAQLAGAEAERHLMFSQAVYWYEQAVQWLPSDRGDSELGRLELALGRALANDKQVERANKVFIRSADAARRARDSALLVDVAMAADGPWISGSEFRNLALSLLDEALEYLDQNDVERRVRALVRIASVLYYTDPEREGKIVDQEMDLASGTSDPAVIAMAQMALHRWLTHDANALSKRIALIRAACSSITPTGQTGGLFLQLQREMLSDLLQKGEVPEFQSTLLEYELKAKEIGSPPDIYWSMVLRATEATLSGDLVMAEQLARGAALRGYELEQLSEGTLILQRFLIRYQQARLAEETPILREVSKASTVFKAGAALIASALSETGRKERAVEVAWDTLGTDGSQLPRDVFWLSALALFSGVAARAKDQDLQRLLLSLVAPCADHVVVFGVGPAVLGSAHYWLGILASALGDSDIALEHLHNAEQVATRIGAPYWVAQAQMDASRVLAKRARGGDIGESAHLAAMASGTAQSLGFARVLCGT